MLRIVKRRLFVHLPQRAAAVVVNRFVEPEQSWRVGREVLREVLVGVSELPVVVALSPMGQRVELEQN